MRCLICVIIINLFSLNLYADREKIAACYEKLAVANDEEKSKIYKVLSLAYYEAQDLENAIKNFLNALDTAFLQSTSVNNVDIGEEAFKIYLDKNAKSLQTTSKEMIELFSDKYLENQNDYLLGFVLALEYANLNQFEQFFEIFYKAYVLSPDHYLKYKTRAILNIKLFDRARTVAEKEKYRLEINLNLKKASDAYALDCNLYQLMILFCEKENKSFLVDTLLNKIINHNIVIPRADISFFVKQAESFDKYELALSFLEKQSLSYPVSRIIDKERVRLLEKTKGNKWKLE